MQDMVFNEGLECLFNKANRVVFPIFFVNMWSHQPLAFDAFCIVSSEEHSISAEKGAYLNKVNIFLYLLLYTHLLRIIFGTNLFTTTEMGPYLFTKFYRICLWSRIYFPGVLCRFGLLFFATKAAISFILFTSTLKAQIGRYIRGGWLIQWNDKLTQYCRRTKSRSHTKNNTTEGALTQHAFEEPLVPLLSR